MTDIPTNQELAAQLSRMRREEDLKKKLVEALKGKQVDAQRIEFVKSLCDNLDRWGKWTDKQLAWAEKLASKYSGARQESLPL